MTQNKVLFSLLQEKEAYFSQSLKAFTYIEMQTKQGSY